MNPLDLLIPVAHAQAGPASAQGGGIGLISFVVMIGVMFLILVLPQSRRAKQHRELIAKLQKGDEVVTNGGMAGRIADIGDSFVTLEVANGVQVKFQRSSIALVLPRGSLKAT